MGSIIKSAKLSAIHPSWATPSFAIRFRPENDANARRVEALIHRIAADLLSVAADHPERKEPIHVQRGDDLILVECDDFEGRAFWAGEAITVLENAGIDDVEIFGVRNGEGE